MFFVRMLHRLADTICNFSSQFGTGSADRLCACVDVLVLYTYKYISPHNFLPSVLILLDNLDVCG